MAEGIKAGMSKISNFMFEFVEEVTGGEVNDIFEAKFIVKKGVVEGVIGKLGEPRIIKDEASLSKIGISFEEGGTIEVHGDVVAIVRRKESVAFNEVHGLGVADGDVAYAVVTSRHVEDRVVKITNFFRRV